MTARTSVALCAALLLSACGGDDDDGCFAAGTPIATPRGDVAIEDLRPGDQVLSMAPATGAVATAIVTHVRRHPGRRFRVLELPGGGRLGLTEDHPVFDRAQGRFVPAGNLSADSRLVALTEGRTAGQERLGSRFVGEGRGDVYDLSVTGQHNFFAAGVLVHNKSPDASVQEDAQVCPPVALCMAWPGDQPAGVHGFLFDGCDTVGCCIDVSDWWAAGSFAEQPEPGATVTPLELAVPDEDGAYQLTVAGSPSVVCAGEPLVGGDLVVVGNCADYPAAGARVDYASGPGGGNWFDCAE